MGYLHYWELERHTFTDEFIKEAAFVIADNVDEVKELEINEKYIAFNGWDGFDRFIFTGNRDSYCKTGIFSPENYDKPICAILLLAVWHFGESMHLESDGLATIHIEPETKRVSRHWEEVLQYVKETFNYQFQRESYKDEVDQDRIKLIPIYKTN
ncbi:hypothetical protein ACFC4S_28750 [Priestia megaterium]|uniref:hypothetical protein n=1 Tax=Priestia megaterium TaxID=1404 RepID=UPI0035D5A1AB